MKIPIFDMIVSLCGAGISAELDDLSKHDCKLGFFCLLRKI